VVLHYTVEVVAVGGTLLGTRQVLDWVVSKLNGWVRPTERVLFVGDPSDPQAAAMCANLLRTERMQLAGWVMSGERSNGNHNGKGNGADGSGRTDRDLGTASDFWRVLQETNADTVVLSGHFGDDQVFEIIVQACAAAGCRLLAASRYEGIGRLHPSVVWYHKLLFVELAAPSAKAYQMFLKRVIDVVGAALGLILLFPLLATTAMAIRLDSPGPIFYRSPRWGRFGREIGIWKFRTMVDGAASLLSENPELSEAYDANIKLVRDPRITRLGQLLRRWSIDELPQLYNVLIGEMSLVGPRPKLRGEEEKYGVVLERVLAVRPGLTGLWQISGRSNTSYQERIALDDRYVAHASLVWDLDILLRTIPVVLTGHGAH
jgi:lipopolysaccharide/colanic/teichoic acid biosynthesis glycosyltransferase